MLDGEFLAPSTTYSFVVNDLCDYSYNQVVFDGSIFTSGAGIDTSYPSVDISYPEPDAIGVPQNIAIEITTNERLDSTTVTNQSFRLWDPSTNSYPDINVTLSSDLQTVFIEPVELLKSDTRYGVMLYGSARSTDLAGLPLSRFNDGDAYPSIIYFTTGSGL